MKRIAALIVIGLLAAVAATAPSPAPTTTVPVLTTTTLAEPSSAAKFSTCPWAVASDTVDTFFALVSLPATDVRITFPLTGEIRLSLEESLPGPSATPVRLGQHLAQGLAPAIIEFSDEPAAVAAVVDGEGLIAGSVCPSSTPKVWYLPGASTAAGERLTLQLFNPFPEDAMVDVSAHSEFGAEPSTGLEGISVQARSWRELELEVLLPVREELAFKVEAQQGNIIAAMAHTSASGAQAVWSGVAPSEVWEFPAASVSGVPARLFISNDGSLEVTFTIDILTSEGSEFGVLTGTIPPLRQAQVDLSQLADGDVGARVTADGPVAAVVVSKGESGLATTPGATTTATRWLLPGVGVRAEAGHRLWLMNSGNNPLTVTLGPLDAAGFLGEPTKVTVAGGAVASIPIDTFRVAALVAEAAGPFTAAWSVIGNGDVALVPGVPVVDR